LYALLGNPAYVEGTPGALAQELACDELAPARHAAARHAEASSAPPLARLTEAANRACAASAGTPDGGGGRDCLLAAALAGAALLGPPGAAARAASCLAAASPPLAPLLVCAGLGHLPRGGDGRDHLLCAVRRLVDAACGAPSCSALQAHPIRVEFEQAVEQSDALLPGLLALVAALAASSQALAGRICACAVLPHIRPDCGAAAAVAAVALADAALAGQSVAVSGGGARAGKKGARRCEPPPVPPAALAAARPAALLLSLAAVASARGECGAARAGARALLRRCVSSLLSCGGPPTALAALPLRQCIGWEASLSLLPLLGQAACEAAARPPSLARLQPSSSLEDGGGSGWDFEQCAMALRDVITLGVALADDTATAEAPKGRSPRTDARTAAAAATLRAARAELLLRLSAAPATAARAGALAAVAAAISRSSPAEAGALLCDVLPDVLMRWRELSAARAGDQQLPSAAGLEEDTDTKPQRHAAALELACRSLCAQFTQHADASGGGSGAHARRLQACRSVAAGTAAALAVTPASGGARAQLAAAVTACIMPCVAAARECTTTAQAEEAAEALLPAFLAAALAMLAAPHTDSGRAALRAGLESWPQGRARSAAEAALVRGVGGRGVREEEPEQ
jgi:hypothetical protein